MLNNLIIAKVYNAFVNNCFVLVGRAYDNLRASGVVDHDMDENTVSENLRRLMHRDSQTNGIVVVREQLIDDGTLLASNQSADALPRIDFQFEKSWSKMLPTFVFYIEAKNLYANNFKKTNNSSITSAKYYHTRYVETGIYHLLDGHYPSNSCLLGYVLEGTVSGAVAGLNCQVTSMLSQAEVLTPTKTVYPSFTTYFSYHKQGLRITHLMLQF
ncbi:MAG: hypothetical protein MJZ32_06920 [Bacteroidaceae bacterium]|nr:hypothetical protein [Bacteroidaceae bacterium]